jgi:crotonobetainyl-CoA:carnitine CoA-transferase CaiB-like acyl-CoA transferase
MPNIPGLPKLVDGTGRAASPICGEHTQEILQAHGYNDPQIADLLARSVAGAPTLAETA